jgi:hypothetical protein
VKRLILFVIVAAFGLAVFGVRTGRVHANLQICTNNLDCSQFSIYLPYDELGNKCDVTEKLSPSAVNCLFLNHSWENLPISVRLTPSSQSHYAWLGCGSGGLPS